MLIVKCFSSMLCMLFTYKPSSWISQSIKNPYQYPLGSFKDLCIHRDRQREAILFNTMLGKICRSRRHICDASTIPSGIKREWYVCIYILRTQICLSTIEDSGITTEITYFRRTDMRCVWVGCHQAQRCQTCAAEQQPAPTGWEAASSPPTPRAQRIAPGTGTCQKCAN
jgi:hypothetical protein